MKKIVIIVCTIVLGISFCIASQSDSKADALATVEMSTAGVNVPTGVFFNGSNFIKVESTWLRIVINGQMKEYSFHAEVDPYGNYALTFGNGQSLTIYSGGRSLYYNGTTYSKK